MIKITLNSTFFNLNFVGQSSNSIEISYVQNVHYCTRYKYMVPIIVELGLWRNVYFVKFYGYGFSY